MTGQVIEKRRNASSLGLDPLQLFDRGWQDNAELQDLTGPDNPFFKYYQPIVGRGPRREFEMEQIIPFDNPDEPDLDPITQASEAYKSGDNETAYQIIEEVLSEDQRCIDAHAHLGNWDFDFYDSPHRHTEERTKHHFQVGLAIAELTLGPAFADLLPYGYIDNRPYLRCLHGYGLCLWRAGNFAAARQVFEKLLCLNPLDNQGARFPLAAIDAGKSWHAEKTEQQI